MCVVFRMELFTAVVCASPIYKKKYWEIVWTEPSIAILFRSSFWGSIGFFCKAEQNAMTRKPARKNREPANRICAAVSVEAIAKKIVAAFYKRKRTSPQHITKNSYNTDNPGFVKRFCSFYPEILLYRNGTEYIVNRLFRLGCGGEDTRCFWKSPIFLRHGLRNSSSQKCPFDTVCK